MPSHRQGPLAANDTASPIVQVFIVLVCRGNRQYLGLSALNKTLWTVITPIMSQPSWDIKLQCTDQWTRSSLFSEKISSSVRPSTVSMFRASSGRGMQLFNVTNHAFYPVADHTSQRLSLLYVDDLVEHSRKTPRPVCQLFNIVDGDLFFWVVRLCP